MSDRITTIVPTSRSVRIAGRDVCVHECRISDLAELQSYLDADWPDPIILAGKRAFDHSVPEEEREAILSKINDEWDEPPAWGSAESSEVFGSSEGAAYLLWVMLRRGQPELTNADIVEILRDCTSEEFGRLRRAFFAVDAIGVIRRSMPILCDLLAQSEGASVPWCTAIDEVARSHHWTYQYIYTLTLSEFRNARSYGEPQEGSEIGESQYRIYIDRLNARIAAKIEAQNRVGADTLEGV